MDLSARSSAIQSVVVFVVETITELLRDRL